MKNLKKNAVFCLVERELNQKKLFVIIFFINSLFGENTIFQFKKVAVLTYKELSNWAILAAASKFLGDETRPFANPKRL